jgi:ABC-type molybdate transport system permease subunit
MASAMRPCIEAIDPRSGEMAAIPDTSRDRIWLTVTLPLIVQGVLATVVLSWPKALGTLRVKTQKADGVHLLVPEAHCPPGPTP